MATESLDKALGNVGEKDDGNSTNSLAFKRFRRKEGELRSDFAIFCEVQLPGLQLLQPNANALLDLFRKPDETQIADNLIYRVFL